jgi:hypothetical protein
MKKTIFIGFPAYNEEDVELTITTALGNAKYPENIHFGILLHYTNGNFPDISVYPNVKYIKSDYPIGLGTGQSRKIVASLHEDEEYYLQVDAHTIFKRNWDSILIKRYEELNKLFYKPIITTMVPTWSKDEFGNILNQNDEQDMSDIEPWGMSFKEINEDIFINTGLPTPHHKKIDFKTFYHEQYLVAANFFFTKSTYLEEIPFDVKIKYHEENITAMRAWTRGYQFFAIKEDIMWTRVMYNKNMPEDSWRNMLSVKDKNGITFYHLAIEGLLRNKDLLTGKVLGKWGAPSQQDLNDYEEVSGINYKLFYEQMEQFAKTNKLEYTRAKHIYDLERSYNVW